jgi:DNA-binding MarR family transcriptional regulator
LTFAADEGITVEPSRFSLAVALVVCYKYLVRVKTPAENEARQLMRAVRGLVRRFAVSERADVACCGMTVAQAATLETLQAEPGLRLRDLGRRLGITPSTLTRNLARLEEAGLVTRADDDDDARAARVALTSAGRRKATELRRQEVLFAEDVLRRLPEERRAALVAGLGDLLAAVRGATEECCPGAFDHLMDEFPNGATCPTERGACAC